MKKRLLSIFMAVAMTLSCFVLPVSAEETGEVRWGSDIDNLTNYGTLAEADAAVESGEAAYVQLLSDITEQINLVGGEATIDLNGHSITYDDKVLLFAGGAKILLTNSSENQAQIISYDPEYPDNPIHIGDAQVTVDDCDLLIKSNGTGASLYEDTSYLHIKGGSFDVEETDIIDVMDGTVKISGEPTGFAAVNKRISLENSGTWEGTLLDLSECTNLNGWHIFNQIFIQESIVVGSDILLPENYSLYSGDASYEEVPQSVAVMLYETHVHDTNLKYENQGESHRISCLVCGLDWMTGHDLDENGACVCGYVCEHADASYVNEGDFHLKQCLVCGVSLNEDHVLEEDGVCKCGYGCKHTETFTSYNEDYHWENCTDPRCREFLGSYVHSFGEDGTCVCGYYEHEHIMEDGSMEVDDESEHSYFCTECELWIYEDHTYDENGDCKCGYYEHEHTVGDGSYNDYGDGHEYRCQECDLWISEDHEYGEDGFCICGAEICRHKGDRYYSVSEFGHNSYCSDCDEYLGYEVHEFGETGVCICKYPEHEHDLKDTIDHYDYEQHATECKICGLLFWADHSYGEDGTCICGYHEHEHVPVEEGMETWGNYHYYLCSECDIWIYEDHKYVDDVCTICERERIAGIVVGESHMKDKDYLDLDGNISESKPEGGYAYYENGILTLHNYSYDGTGYESEEGYDGILTEHDLEIVLEGDNFIRCTGGDGIAVYYGTLKITGEGSLTVHGEDGGDGIDVYGDVVIDAKTLEIYSEDHGIEVDGKLLVKDGDFKVTAGDDGFDTDGVEIWNGTFDISAEDIGIDSSEEIFIRDGSITITTRDDSGMEAGLDIEIWNGTYDIQANGDGLYAGGTVSIKGGQFNIDAGCCGICTVGGIVMSENAQIILPQDAKIAFEEYGEDRCYYVYDANDEVATKIQISSTDGIPYEDVTKADWFYDAVYLNYKAGTMTGMDETHFGPYGQLSRAQFALILYRMSDAAIEDVKNPFKDIAGDEWYADAVLWAAQNGIVTGYQDGNFGPADYITREQMAVMMYRYAKYLGMDVQAEGDYSAFKDAASVSPFAEDAIKWAFSNGIITGKENGTLLDPQGYTARAETAVIIERFLSK